MQILVTVVSLVVLIPAGLAGIRASLIELPGPPQELTRALSEAWTASEPLWVWCQVLGCGLAGLAMLGLAVVVGWRGLQSLSVNHPQH